MNSTNSIDMQTWRIDYDYLKTMGMELAAGRNFSKEYGTDSSAIIITETTAKLLGYTDAIGRQGIVGIIQNRSSQCKNIDTENRK